MLAKGPGQAESLWPLLGLPVGVAFCCEVMHELDWESMYGILTNHSLLGCMISCRVHENRSIFSAAVSAAMRRYSVPLTVLYTVKTRVEVGAAGVHTEVNCEGGQQGVSAAHPRSTS